MWRTFRLVNSPKHPYGDSLLRFRSPLWRLQPSAPGPRFAVDSPRIPVQRSATVQFIAGSTYSVIALLSCAFAELLTTFVQATVIAELIVPRGHSHARLASWSFSLELPILVDTLLIFLQLIVGKSGCYKVLVAFMTFYPVFRRQLTSIHYQGG